MKIDGNKMGSVFVKTNAGQFVLSAFFKVEKQCLMSFKLLVLVNESDPHAFKSCAILP